MKNKGVEITMKSMKS